MIKIASSLNDVNNRRGGGGGGDLYMSRDHSMKKRYLQRSILLRCYV